MNSKNYKKLIPLFFGVLLVSSQGVFATDTYQINDGATAHIQGSETGYTLTVTSTTAADGSTAVLDTVADGSNKTVTLNNASVLTGYYGQIKVTNDTTLDIQASTANKTIPADLYVAGSDATTTLKLTAIATGTTFSGSNNTGGYGLKIDNYGVVDMSAATQDITINKKIHFNGYEANAPYIKYAPTGALTSTLPKIIVPTTNETITSTGTDGALYASKHFTVDLTNATASTLNSTAYPLMQITDTATAPTIAGSDLNPTITGNSDSAWTIGNMTVTNPADNTRNVNLVVTYDPLFALDTTVNGYGRTIAATINGGTEGIGDSAETLQTLRKNKTSGTASTVSKNLSIDLGIYTLGGVSQTWAITDSKGLALKGTGGKFDGQVTFGDTASNITILGTSVTNAIFGDNFGGSGAISGFLQIGDGTNAASYTHRLSDNKVTTDNKFSKIVVKGNAALTITQ